MQLTVVIYNVCYTNIINKPKGVSNLKKGLVSEGIVV